MKKISQLLMFVTLLVLISVNVNATGLNHSDLNNVCKTLGGCTKELKKHLKDYLKTPGYNWPYFAVEENRMFNRPGWSLSFTHQRAKQSCREHDNKNCVVVISNRKIINKKFENKFLKNKSKSKSKSKNTNLTSNNQVYFSDKRICLLSTSSNGQDWIKFPKKYYKEAKKRVLTLDRCSKLTKRGLDTQNEMTAQVDTSIVQVKASIYCKYNNGKSYPSHKCSADQKQISLNEFCLDQKTNSNVLQHVIDKHCSRGKNIPETQIVTQSVQIPKNKVDKIAPILAIEDRITVTDRTYSITGRVSDDSDVFVEADGISIPVKNNQFTINGSSSIGITKYKIVAFDKWGNETTKDIIVERVMQLAKTDNALEQLKPENLRSKNNKNRIALIIGIEEYENISNANYAKRDAEYFIDYVQSAFGVPQSKIKYFFNENAEEKSKFQIKTWLKKNVRNNTEIYVYFSGHGMALNDGKELYLLTHDTITEYINETAFNRNEIFNDIAQYNPKSVTAFLDTCYSGAGRADGEMLLAMAKGLVVVDEQQQKLPDNFTLFTAASAQESAWSLPEAQHGTFSYFLMKGMEGNADLNGDKKLTNGELRDYLLDNVGRYAQKQQTPQMVGDPNQVLIKF